MTLDHIGVIGAGAWGSALANIAARAGRDVTLWGRNPTTTAAIAATRENPRLPGIRIDERVAVTAELAQVARADAILVVVPAQDLRAAAMGLAPMLRDTAPVITAAKGIERGTRLFMTQVIAQALPGAVPAILSGPSFAADVARGLPTAVTLAASDDTLAS